MAQLASVLRALQEAFSLIWRKLVEICLRWRAKSKLSERARRMSPAECVPINEAAFHRPDPLIYSQYDLMRRGLAVTWENPDIELRENGVPVPAMGLTPATEYEIVARIWNNSIDAPVVALPVGFSFLSFGIGVQSHPIGATAVNLGVKGGPDHPALVSMKWRTPPDPGHYCIQVLLSPVDDTNFQNNLGQHNIVVGHPRSPAEFAFQLRNARPVGQMITFEIDTYRIPRLPRCDEIRSPRPTASPFAPSALDGRPATAVPPAHDRARYPLPPDWAIEIEPETPRLEPSEQISVRLRVTPPPGFAGTQAININAMDAIGLAGGVTLHIQVP